MNKKIQSFLPWYLSLLVMAGMALTMQHANANTNSDHTNESEGIMTNETKNAKLTILIKNGLVIDGTGASGVRKDVLIVGDTIKMIGDCSGMASDKIIDATGKVVCPGFIDPHTHCNDGSPVAYIRQGVTTVIGGNCGSASSVKNMRAAHAKAKKLSNLGHLVGLNSIGRANTNRPPTAPEMAAMKKRVADNMADGAFGISSGLIYNPGCYATTEEIIELCKAAEKRGFYASHIRNEADKVLEAMEEAIRIGKESGLPVHISHHKVCGFKDFGKSKETLALVDRANAEGIKVTMDQYPYTASSTSLRVSLPLWALEGTSEEIIARLDDPEKRAAIKEYVEKRLADYYGGELERVVISSCSAKQEFSGKNLRDITIQQKGVADIPNGAEVLIDIVRLAPEAGKTTAIFYSIDEEDVQRIMRHPLTAICSDGTGGGKHPRNYGPFPRVLGRYCRELKLFSLEEAVRKMTSLPADIVGLDKRGVLKEGFYADVVVFDPETVIDRATFENPNQPPVGIEYVLVNGKLTIENGTLTGEEGGRFLSCEHEKKDRKSKKVEVSNYQCKI